MVISCLLDNVSLTNNPEKKVCVFADEYSLIVLIHLFAFHFFLHVLKKKRGRKSEGHRHMFCVDRRHARRTDFFDSIAGNEASSGVKQMEDVHWT